MEKKKKLILTEKPSVAWDFSRALGSFQRFPAHLESDEYLITWAIGHLLELFQPEDYDSQWKTWKFQHLPILPEEIKYKPIERTHKHLREVLKVLRRKDISQIIVATDAGREGELIARLLLTHAKVSPKNIFRFWTGLALTPPVIQRYLSQLKPWGEFQNLYEAGRARQICDWLVGINFSRAATLSLGDLYSVGRVQTAVLSFLVDRKKERENFQPKPFWTFEAQFKNRKGIWKGVWFDPRKKGGTPHHFDELEEAQAIFRQWVPGKEAQVLSVDKKPKSIPPPQLFNLTELQREANKQFGMTAQKTLEAAQSLYEKGKCLSYPRTNSRVLGRENFPLVQKVVQHLSPHFPEIFQTLSPEALAVSNLRVFNDQEVQDHHAMIPLHPPPKGTSPEALKVYQLVLRRFAAVFHSACSTLMIEVVTEASEKLLFKSRGTAILSPGWTLVEKNSHLSSTSLLPPLEKGDKAQVEKAELVEGRTVPPPEYTDSSLLGDMENPSRKVEEEEYKSLFRGSIGLGTESTRAQIIETLLNRQYVIREKRILKATEKGEKLVTSIRALPHCQVLATPAETARWEEKLHKISKGEGKMSLFLKEMEDFLVRGLKEWQKNPDSSSSSGGPSRPPPPPVGPPVGPCPACARPVLEGKWTFECSGKRDGKCTFSLNKTIGEKALTPTFVKKLLKQGISPLLKGIKNKEGKKFNAHLKLVAKEKDGKDGINVIFYFPPS